jgi:hypothetical protein
VIGVGAVGWLVLAALFALTGLLCFWLVTRPAEGLASLPLPTSGARPSTQRHVDTK